MRVVGGGEGVPVVSTTLVVVDPHVGLAIVLLIQVTPNKDKLVILGQQGMVGNSDWQVKGSYEAFVVDQLL